RWIASIISFRAGSTIARASSGSMFSIRSIEPLMSANSAVTVLRSPSNSVEASACSALRRIPNASGLSVEATGALALDVSTRAVPHSPQNFSPAVYGVPQAMHLSASGLPHSTQNLRPGRLSLPHEEQCIGSPHRFFHSRGLCRYAEADVRIVGAPEGSGLLD